MEWREIKTNDKMNQTLIDCLEMRKDNMSLYAIKRISELQSRLEKAEELLKRHLEQKTAEEEMNYTTDVYAFLNEGKKD